MTDEERSQEGAEEEIEDLEAPATAQREVAGGLPPCAPTNACRPVNTVVSCKPYSPTQACLSPTCSITKVEEADA